MNINAQLLFKGDLYGQTPNLLYENIDSVHFKECFKLNIEINIV